MGLQDELDVTMMFDIEIPSPTMDLLYGRSVPPNVFLQILNMPPAVEIRKIIHSAGKRKYIVVSYESDGGTKHSLAYRCANHGDSVPYTVDKDYPEYDRLHVARAIADALNETAL